jgi:hypothetical protein
LKNIERLHNQLKFEEEAKIVEDRNWRGMNFEKAMRYSSHGKSSFENGWMLGVFACLRERGGGEREREREEHDKKVRV